MTALLDTNALIALTVTDHVHHDLLEDWFSRRTEPIATCPVTQGALVRFLVRNGATAQEAVAVVRGVAATEGHEFWSDDVSYDQIDMRAVVGHKQVTDAYLAGLARSRSGRLATLDRALAVLHDDVTLLLDGVR